jgi:hypothetical protein
MVKNNQFVLKPAANSFVGDASTDANCCFGTWKPFLGNLGGKAAIRGDMLVAKKYRRIMSSIGAAYYLTITV